MYKTKYMSAGQIKIYVERTIAFSQMNMIINKINNKGDKITGKIVLCITHKCK